MIRRASRIGLLFPELGGVLLKDGGERCVLVFRAYIDDSGSGDPPVSLLAGYLARADKWDAFDGKWRATLDGPPRLEYFKMKEAFALEDQFSGWSVPSRDKLIAKLLRIINRIVVCAISVTVYHDDYNRLCRGRVNALFDNPYWLLFYSVMRYVTTWQNKFGIVDPTVFVFDEQGKQTGAVQASWSAFYRILPPNMRSLISGRPLAANEKTALPLQAADLIAWHLRRIYAEGNNGGILSAPCIGALTDIPLYEYLWTPQRLRVFMRRSEQLTQEHGMIFPHRLRAIEKKLPD